MVFQPSLEKYHVDQYYKAIDHYHDYIKRCDLINAEPIFQEHYKAIADFQYKAISDPHAQYQSYLTGVSLSLSLGSILLVALLSK